jgi:hypothetical protein
MALFYLLCSLFLHLPKGHQHPRHVLDRADQVAGADVLVGRVDARAWVASAKRADRHLQVVDKRVVRSRAAEQAVRAIRRTEPITIFALTLHS